MSQTNHHSPLDEHREYITELAADPTLTNNDIAVAVYTELGVQTSEAGVRRALRRWEVTRNTATFEPAGSTVSDNEGTLIGAPTETVQDAEELMKERGFDPEHWEIVSATVNEYEGAPAKVDQKAGKSGNRKYRQLKLHLRKKLEVSFPKAADRDVGKTVAAKKPSIPVDQDKLVVFAGDQQAPFHDKGLHEAFCGWLKENKPEQGVLIGDTVDFPDISRHRLNPEGTARVQECINAGYDLLHDYVDASPDTKWTKLCGNHDERIRNTLIDWAVELYGIKRAEVDDKDEDSVLSITHLLRLDELDIEYLEPNGSYEHLQVNVSPYLAARHGWLASKGSGSSALKTLEHLGYSIVVGHTHRQSLVHKTTHDIHGEPTTLAAVETGCMCQIEGGLTYAVAPDWQNGFASARVWADGKFKLDLATYVNDTLLWRDQRYE